MACACTSQLLESRQIGCGVAPFDIGHSTLHRLLPLDPLGRLVAAGGCCRRRCVDCDARSYFYVLIATRRHVRELQAAIVARRRRQGLSGVGSREVSKKVRCATDVCESMVPCVANRTVMRRGREPQRHELGSAVSLHNTVRRFE